VLGIIPDFENAGKIGELQSDTPMPSLLYSQTPTRDLISVGVRLDRVSGVRRAENANHGVPSRPLIKIQNLGDIVERRRMHGTSRATRSCHTLFLRAIVPAAMPPVSWPPSPGCAVLPRMVIGLPTTRMPATRMLEHLAAAVRHPPQAMRVDRAPPSCVVCVVDGRLRSVASNSSSLEPSVAFSRFHPRGRRRWPFFFGTRRVSSKSARRRGRRGESSAATGTDRMAEPSRDAAPSRPRGRHAVIGRAVAAGVQPPC
jgi:hypothetical protein